VNNLYLEDWEFGTENGSPSTKNSKFNWTIKKYDVKGILVDNNVNNIENTDNNTKINNNEEKYSPYSFDKFHNILNVSKLTYPDSHTIVKKE